MENTPIWFFCWNLANHGKVFNFIVTTAFTMLTFLIYGYFLELLFRLEGMKDHSWYLTLVQFLYYVMFGLAEKLFTSWSRLRMAPLASYLLLAMLTVATMGLSNMAVGYLNYPTQVIFKCCKLIPVMIGGILIQGKHYSGMDFLACICMTVGLIFFTLADSQLQPDFNISGIVIISGALLADAVIGNYQEKTMKKYSASNAEVILYSYGLGSIYILAGLILSSQLLPAVVFFSQHPKETYGYGVVFSLTGYLGINAVLTQVKLFGALTAVTVTTFRKVATIILSFIAFSKPFTVRYLWSGAIVVLGIYLNVFSKSQQGFGERIKSFVHKFRKGTRHGHESVDVV